MVSQHNESAEHEPDEFHEFHEFHEFDYDTFVRDFVTGLDGPHQHDHDRQGDVQRRR